MARKRCQSRLPNDYARAQAELPKPLPTGLRSIVGRSTSLRIGRERKSSSAAFLCPASSMESRAGGTAIRFLAEPACKKMILK